MRFAGCQRIIGVLRGQLLGARPCACSSAASVYGDQFSIAASVHGPKIRRHIISDSTAGQDPAVHDNSGSESKDALRPLTNVENARQLSDEDLAAFRSMEAADGSKMETGTGVLTADLDKYNMWGTVRFPVLYTWQALIVWLTHAQQDNKFSQRCSCGTLSGLASLDIWHDCEVLEIRGFPVELDWTGRPVEYG